MEIIKFDVSSKGASFTSPEINTFIKTYPHIHKCSILGVLGAIIGIEKEIREEVKKGIIEKNPSCYEKLKDLKISIVPKEIAFPSCVVDISDTTCMVNKGNSFNTHMEVLQNPRWTIYVMGENNPYYDKIKDYLVNKKYHFLPYLGRNNFPANIDKVEVLEGIVLSNETVDKIDSLFVDEVISHSEDEEEDFSFSAGTFYLPIGYNDRKTYDEKLFTFTNDIVSKIEEGYEIISCQGKKLFVI